MILMLVLVLVLVGLAGVGGRAALTARTTSRAPRIRARYLPSAVVTHREQPAPHAHAHLYCTVLVPCWHCGRVLCTAHCAPSLALDPPTEVVSGRTSLSHAPRTRPPRLHYLHCITSRGATKSQAAECWRCVAYGTGGYLSQKGMPTAQTWKDAGQQRRASLRTSRTHREQLPQTNTTGIELKALARDESQAM